MFSFVHLGTQYKWYHTVEILLQLPFSAQYYDPEVYVLCEQLQCVLFYCLDFTVNLFTVYLTSHIPQTWSMASAVQLLIFTQGETILLSEDLKIKRKICFSLGLSLW